MSVHNPGNDSSSSDGGSDPGMSISAVSRMTGVPAPTIRSWERRYGLPTAGRSSNGYRRYTLADVDALIRLRDQISGGRNASDAAALLREAAATPPDQVRDLLLAAAHQLDPRAIRRELEQAHRRHGLEATLEQVMLPALREIGRGWAAGSYVVAHEHLLTGAVSSWLAAVEQQAPPPARGAPMVFACGPAEQHTLALQALAVLLAHRGFDCRILGGQTPTDSLAVAVAASRAQALIVVAHLDENRPAALTALQALAALPCRLYYAGAAFTEPGSRQSAPGTYLGESLSTAAQQIADDADETDEADDASPDAPGTAEQSASDPLW